MRGLLVVTVCLLVVLVPLSAAPDRASRIPATVDVCYRDDPKVAECLKNDIEKMVSTFKSGSKDFDLGSMDPLVFQNLVFDYNSVIIGGYLELPEVAVSGLSKLKVTRIKPKVNVPKKFALDFTGHIPVINIRSPYNLTGSFLTIPINIDGLLDINLEEVDISYVLRGDVKEDGDGEYLDLKMFNFRLMRKDIKTAYFVDENVVQGRPTLNRAIVAALTNNWRIVMDNLVPVMFPVTDKLMRDHFKGLFKKYPYDVLFPKTKKPTKPNR